MSDALEAAFGKYGDQGMAAAAETIVTFVRAAVGCPECEGTNIPTMHPETTFVDGKRYGIVDCPAEHVELSILGETIWADPTKCEWRCRYLELVFVPDGTPGQRIGLPEHCETEDHARCGWQPRMDALFGAE